MHICTGRKGIGWHGLTKTLGQQHREIGVLITGLMFAALTRLKSFCESFVLSRFSLVAVTAW